MAIKTIKKSKIETEADLIRIRREIQIMSSVQHPNIIHIYEGRAAQNKLCRKHYYYVLFFQYSAFAQEAMINKQIERVNLILPLVFENKEKMVLVMEIAAGGELYDYLSERKCLEENEARRVFRQIACAVYYCHKNNICHRDLKLENILLDENGNAKVGRSTSYYKSNQFNFHTFLI